MKVGLSDITRQAIQNNILNYLSSIKSDEEVDITFSNIDDGETNNIVLTCIKKSKDPNMSKSVILTDNKLDIDVGTNATDSKENSDKGEQQSDKTE